MAYISRVFNKTELEENINIYIYNKIRLLNG